MVKDPSRRRLALADRLIEVIDERQTGETILDEALKMMKSSEKYGTGAWVDLMSGMPHLCAIRSSCLSPLFLRRDLECNENRLSAQAGSRTVGERSSRQGRPPNREKEFSPLRHGNSPYRGHER